MALISHSQNLVMDEGLALVSYLNTSKRKEFFYDV